MLAFGSVFFVKQKTAYEMRISDWSSDVCSSDLVRGNGCLDPFRDPHPLGRRIQPDRAARDRVNRGHHLSRAWHVGLARAVQIGDVVALPAAVRAMNQPDHRLIDAVILADRQSTRLNSSPLCASRIPSSSLNNYFSSF